MHYIYFEFLGALDEESEEYRMASFIPRSCGLPMRHSPTRPLPTERNEDILPSLKIPVPISFSNEKNKVFNANIHLYFQSKQPGRFWGNIAQLA